MKARTDGIEGAFHRASRGYLTRRAQGYVMGAFREAMAATVTLQQERMATQLKELFAALDAGNQQRANALRATLTGATESIAPAPRPVLEAAHTVIRNDYLSTDGNEAYDSQFDGAHVLYCVCPPATPLESVTHQDHLQLAHADDHCTVFSVHVF